MLVRSAGFRVKFAANAIFFRDNISIETEQTRIPRTFLKMNKTNFDQTE